MLKKALPFVLISGLALGACNGNNNGAMPNNNETPMENTDRERNWTPDANNDQTGPDVDGLDDNRNRNNGGTVNDNNNDDGLLDGGNDGDLLDGDNDGLLNGDRSNNGTMRDQDRKDEKR